MTIESDQNVLLELIELAVTWPELEYSETPTIAPEHCMRFVESHTWADPDRVERIFSVATDIVMTATRATRRRPTVSDCRVGQVDNAAPLTVPDIPMARRDVADLGPVTVALGGAAFTRLVADHVDRVSRDLLITS